MLNKKSVDDINVKGKKVLVTGHTGFKGTWLCKILTMLGADIIGYSLESPTVEGWEFFRIRLLEEWLWLSLLMVAHRLEWVGVSHSIV